MRSVLKVSLRVAGYGYTQASSKCSNMMGQQLNSSTEVERELFNIRENMRLVKANAGQSDEKNTPLKAGADQTYTLFSELTKVSELC